jgi:outer membrane protein OmpA-like peptidoglycan-associated protein
MKKAGLAFFYALVLLFNLSQVLNPEKAACEEFEYKYHLGERYRILSTVNEQVYIDRRLSHQAEILNRIAVEVSDVKDGKGRLEAVFQTSERSSVVQAGRGTSPLDTSFQWAEEYETVFERDKLGYVSIDPRYFMPVVRDVPVFPGRDLKPGETWSAEGHEMHDFRESFGIAQPYRIPFTAYYTFLGERQWKGKTYPAFSVSYRIDARPGAVRGRLWPRRITGSSEQIVYWGREEGQPVAYEENFSMTFELSDGGVVEFRGSATAELLESERMDKEKLASEITGEIDRLNIPDANVRVVDEGISISLEDIKFKPDSAEMLPGEQEKLDRIAGILARYPERDIMVAGHTALAGTVESRVQLSIDRAKVVTNYLLAKKVRPPDRIVVRGYGSDRPIADNSTEEGMRKNRRVEIILLEN